jgi:AraC-like DNA-binding protein
MFRGLRQRARSDLWLAALLLVLSSSLITPFIGFANVYDSNQWLTYFPFSIGYLAGVLVWFYTVTLTDSKYRLKRSDLAYFIPTLLYLSYRFFLFSHSVEWKTWYDSTYQPVSAAVIFVTELAWTLTLLFLSTRHYRRYRIWLNENYSDTEKIKFNWLRNFLYVFSSVTLLGALFDFTNSFLFRLSYIQYFYFELVLAFSTYYLAIAGYLRSRVIEPHFVPAEVPAVDERRAPISGTELARLKEKLAALIDEKQPHLDSTLTLADLTKMLGVNANVLSYVINRGFGMNFNDLINSRRIEDVKRRLLAADGSTVTEIAFDCGFNSKATFNRAFRKLTGMSPREFQDISQE